MIGSSNVQQRYFEFIPSHGGAPGSTPGAGAIPRGVTVTFLLIPPCSFSTPTTPTTIDIVATRVLGVTQSPFFNFLSFCFFAFFKLRILTETKI